LGLQLIDRTQDFTRSSREGSIPIARGWVGKLRPEAGGSKDFYVPPARCEHTTLKPNVIGVTNTSWIHKSRASNSQKKSNECIELTWTGKVIQQCLNSTQKNISASNKVEKNSAHPWDADDIEERLLLEKNESSGGFVFYWKSIEKFNSGLLKQPDNQKPQRIETHQTNQETLKGLMLGYDEGSWWCQSLSCQTIKSGVIPFNFAIKEFHEFLKLLVGHANICCIRHGALLNEHVVVLTTHIAQFL